MKKPPLKLIFAAVLAVLFLALTVSLLFVDRAPYGDGQHYIGFATLNKSFHECFKANDIAYKLTEMLGYFSLLFVLGFTVVGLVQWIKRKSLFKVDPDILLLGGFYLFVLALYVLFCYVTVNCRPIAENGVYEPSFPSSHTILAVFVLSTAVLQLKRRISNRVLSLVVNITLGVLTVAMITGRLISGVHWYTDILGSILLGGSLIFLYSFAEDLVLQKQYKQK